MADADTGVGLEAGRMEISKAALTTPSGARREVRSSWRHVTCWNLAMDEAFCLAGIKTPRITDDDPGSRPHEGKTAMMTKTAPKTAPWIALAGALTLAACTTTD